MLLWKCQYCAQIIKLTLYFFMTIENPEKLEQTIQELAQKGLGEYLSNLELRKVLVDWLHEELDFKKAYIKLALTIITPPVQYFAKKAGAQVNSLILNAVYNKILKNNFIKQILEQLAKLDDKNQIKETIRKYIDTKDQTKHQLTNEDLELNLALQIEALQITRDLSDKYEEIKQDIEQLKADIVWGFSNLATLLEAQPALTIPLNNDNTQGFNRFIYSSRSVPLIGRDKQMQELEKFLFSPDMFKCWLVIGEAGSGKSRLALELCIRNGGAMHCGFYQNTANVDWNRWQPQQPSLLIIDYIQRKKFAKKIGNIVKSLQSRSSTLEYPVRILLLERSIKTTWFHDFIGTGTRRSFINSAWYGKLKDIGHDDSNQGYLQLSGLEIDEIKQVTSEFIDHEPNQQLINQVSKVDPKQRPLFVLLVAAAFQDNPKANFASIEKIIDDLIRREKKIGELQK